MILPILTYGQPILREVTSPVVEDSESLQRLIDDMIETMQNASGVGLAAPQVGRSERLFIVDFSRASDESQEGQSAELAIFGEDHVALINPEILEADLNTEIEFEEGCLSIPGINEWVTRPDRLRVRFLDRHFQVHDMPADGIFSRVFQHELDHLNGVLFLDHVSALKKRLLRRRLSDMAAGVVEAAYPVSPPGVVHSVQG